MATQAIETAGAESIAKVKDVLNDMDSRRILGNPDEATAYIAASMESFSDFENYAIAAPGVALAEDGGLIFDPEIYTADTRVMVAVLKNRGDTPGNSTVKAIVISPVPTIEAILANAEALAWATRIIEKELNHVAVRQLRKAEDVAEVVDSMPKTLQDYITSDRGGGGLLEAYESLWRAIKNNMAKLSRSWKLANLSKKELRRGLESSSYAQEYYPTLEETKQGSLFQFALNGFILASKKGGLDPSIFERWLENRDEKVIDVAAEDEEDFSLEDLTAAMDSNDDEPATPAPVTDDDEATEENTAPPAE